MTTDGDYVSLTFSGGEGGPFTYGPKLEASD